jgi:hypothetical protein
MTLIRPRFPHPRSRSALATEMPPPYPRAAAGAAEAAAGEAAQPNDTPPVALQRAQQRLPQEKRRSPRTRNPKKSRPDSPSHGVPPRGPGCGWRRSTQNPQSSSASLHATSRNPQPPKPRPPRAAAPCLARFAAPRRRQCMRSPPAGSPARARCAAEATRTKRR